jgi:hypothetical protein
MTCDRIVLGVLTALFLVPAAEAQVYPLRDYPDLGYFRCDEGAGAVVANTAFPMPTAAPFTIPMPGSATWVVPGRLGAAALNVAAVTMGAGVPLATGVSPNYGGNFTIEFWMRPEGPTHTNLLFDSTAGAFQFVGPPTAAASQFSWRGGGTTATNEYVNFAYNPTPGVWQHIAAVQEATLSQRRVYVNGALAGITTFAPPPAGYPASTGLVFGGTIAGGPVSDFAFDEIRIWSRVLSATEISTWYQQTRPRRNALQASQTAPGIGDLRVDLFDASTTADKGWTLVSTAVTGPGNLGPVFGIYFDSTVWWILTDPVTFPQAPGFIFHFPRNAPGLWPDAPFLVGPGGVLALAGQTMDLVVLLTQNGIFDSTSNVVRFQFQ